MRKHLEELRIRAEEVEDPRDLALRSACGQILRDRIREERLNHHSLSEGRQDALRWLLRGVTRSGEIPNDLERRMASKISAGHLWWTEEVIYELVRCANGDLDALSNNTLDLLEDFL
jgi:hypothetical protein